MDYRHILISAGLSALAGWLAKTLHIKAKSAAQADKLLGGEPGTAQGLVDAAEQAGLDALQNAAQKALDKGGK